MVEILFIFEEVMQIVYALLIRLSIGIIINSDLLHELLY